MDDTVTTEEESLAEQLREAQRAAIIEEEQTSEEEEDSELQGATHKEEISLTNAGSFATILFLFFDLPQIILDFFGIGFFVNWFIGLIGWLSIYTWLMLNGRSIFGGSSKNDISGIFIGNILGEILTAGFWTGLSGFVILFIIKERAQRALEQELERSSTSRG